MELAHLAIQNDIKHWLEEDGLFVNHFYLSSLPRTPVQLKLKFKSDLIVAGTHYFEEVFKQFSAINIPSIHTLEGQKVSKGDIFNIPQEVSFATAISAERLALNLLQRASSIATYTNFLVKKVSDKGIKILDTRKSTPGLRSLEKYAVRIGGGYNHRFGQQDTWMIKDNHKMCMGGLKGARDFFQAQGVFYNNLITEIHNEEEFFEALELGFKHLMLDNFSPDKIRELMKYKKDGMTVELSGGITGDNIDQYAIEGVDAISSGSLFDPPKVDISLKFELL